MDFSQIKLGTGLRMDFQKKYPPVFVIFGVLTRNLCRVNTKLRKHWKTVPRGQGGKHLTSSRAGNYRRSPSDLRRDRSRRVLEDDCV